MRISSKLSRIKLPENENILFDLSILDSVDRLGASFQGVPEHFQETKKKEYASNKMRQIPDDNELWLLSRDCEYTSPSSETCVIIGSWKDGCREFSCQYDVSYYLLVHVYL